MPKPLQYNAGMLIYFNGDPADKVFILQAGLVNLSYQDIETGQDVRDTVQPGEFFGVKSALGRYPREENAMAMNNATVMAFTVPEFETLAMGNTRIIMKMLKVFSNQLRKVHKQVSSLMATEEQNPEEGLFRVGEYYLKASNYKHAQHIFNRYLTFYPSGKYASQATSNLRQAVLYGSSKSSPSPAASPEPSLPVEEPALPADVPDIPAEAPASQDAHRQDLTMSAKSYYDGVSFISQQKYQQAYLTFKKIVDENEDQEYAAKSFFEIGKCLFLLNKYDECIKHYTMAITKYPKHPDLADALFYIGQCYEKNNRKDLAGTFYKKILSMSGNENDGTHIKAKRALNMLEA